MLSQPLEISDAHRELNAQGGVGKFFLFFSFRNPVTRAPCFIQSQIGAASPPFQCRIYATEREHCATAYDSPSVLEPC